MRFSTAMSTMEQYKRLPCELVASPTQPRIGQWRDARVLSSISRANGFIAVDTQATSLSDRSIRLFTRHSRHSSKMLAEQLGTRR